MKLSIAYEVNFVNVLFLMSMVWQGVMSEAIPWKLLQDQYFSDNSYEDEIAKLVHSPEDVRCCCF